MHRIAVVLLASTALTLSQQAGAADLPLKAARPVAVAPAPYNWTGFYLGAHLGAGWSRNRFHDPSQFCFDGFCTSSEAGSHNGLGVLAGGQLGYNYQFGRWLVGIEGQFSWADLKGDHLNVDPFFGGKNDRFSTHVKSLGTIAGRFGIVSDPNDRTLFYVKGGAAFANTRYNVQSTRIFADGCQDDPSCIGLSTANLSGSKTRWGWMAGIGMEYGLTNNWSTKVEYNYMDLGNKDVTLTGQFCDPDCSSSSRSLRIDQTIHVLKFGVNYRFAGP